MFFDDEPLVKRKSAQLRALPPVIDTGWRPPQQFPNLESASLIGFDVETYDPHLTEAGPGWARGKGHIVGISLSAEDRLGNTGSWYFPMRHTVEPEYNLDPAQVMRFAKHTLETRTPKVGANLLYDVGWLSEEGINVKGELHDIQFGEALIDEDAFVALEHLGHKYLGEGKETNALYDWIKQAYKTPDTLLRRDIHRSPPRLVGPYAQSDTALPIRILKAQWGELARQGLSELYRLECDLIPLLVRMRREGVTVNVGKAEQMKAELELETIELYKRIPYQYGVTIESCSNANLEFLFNHIGIPFPRNAPSKTRPEGTGKFEKEWLKALEHPVGELINEIREHEKICGTFLQSYVIDKNINGKLYPQFHPLKSDDDGTKVGRFSSSDPNLQNIPARTKLGKRVREAFEHDAGHYQWRKHDYSQIHYRILAHNAVDGNITREDVARVFEFWNSGSQNRWGGIGAADALRDRYRQDPNTDYHRDVYNNVAPFMGWSLTDKDIIEEKRRPIKNVNFGLLYGQSQKSLAYKAGFSGAQAKEFFEFYHQGAPYVKSTMKAIALEVQQLGYVSTVLGRRIRFNLWEPNDYEIRSRPLPYDDAIRYYGPNIKRAFDYRGVNYKFQGTEPDIMKTGMRNCMNSGVFDYVGVPRLTVHDELDWSVRDDTALTREAFEFIQHTMQNAIKLRVPVKVDVSTGANWGKAK